MHLAKTAEKITPPTRLGVWQARLLLALWAVTAFAFLAVFILDLRVSYGLMAAPCVGPDCHYQAITPTEAEMLTGWDLSTPGYALYMLGISTLPVIAFTITDVVGEAGTGKEAIARTEQTLPDVVLMDIQ